MIPVEKLISLKIFKETSAESLAGLAKDMEETVFKKGDKILREGDSTGSLNLIASGSVAVEKKLGNRSKVVARLEAEEFFGEMAFLENQPHSATILAQEETRIYSLPRQALDSLFKKDPKMALGQVMTLLAGVSSRLRSTTNELVTVFEVARAVGLPSTASDLVGRVLDQLGSELGGKAAVAVYRWNPFNDEYQFVLARGPKKDKWPPVIEKEKPLLSFLAEEQVSLKDLKSVAGQLDPLPFSAGHLVLSPSNMADSKEGLFLYFAEEPDSFDSGQRQMMETVSAVLAPALVTARGREEEAARDQLERRRQEGYSL